MTKSDTGAPLSLVTGDTSTSARPRDDYASNLSAINTEVANLRSADIAALAYVDALIQSRSIKDPVRVVATGNLALTGLVAVDGVTLVDGDRVLAAGQSTASQNGIYVVHAGSWTRSTDADTSSEMKPGLICWVSEGTSNADSLWELTTDGPITLGTTSLTFAVKSGNAAGFALQSALAAEAVTARAAEATMRQRFNTIAAAKTASYSAQVWDSATYDTTSGPISQPLPTSPVAGDEFEAFSNYNTSGNLLTLTGTGGPFTLNPGHGVVFRWNGSAWVERQDRKTKASLDASYAPRSTKKAVNPATWRLEKPTIMTASPVFTSGVANAATAIASSVLIPSYEGSAFTFLGGPTVRGTTFPDYTGIKLGVYPQITSNPPTTVQFILDTADATGRFEISLKGMGLAYRVLVLNSATDRWEYATSTASVTAHPSDGNGYLDLVTLGAAGNYTIRIEFPGSQAFSGIRVGPTDTVTGSRRAPKRYIIAGDSFTEPTIVDSGGAVQGDGYPVLLAHMTGLDIWAAGSGGTGYLQTNGGRPKLRDRLANDILAFNPDGIIWAMGINDSSFTAAQVGAESLACFQQALAFNPDIDNVVLSPFTPKAVTSLGGGFIAQRDAIKASALAVGARFLDLLSLPTADYLGTWSSTLAASASASATTISVASLPTYFVAQLGVGGLNGWYVQIGTDSSCEVRQVTNIAGSGPYTLSVAALSSAHASGQTVSLCGPGYITGTGKQGTPTGTGNADRYTGSDGTHPTKAGHEYTAKTIAWLWARSLQLNP